MAASASSVVVLEAQVASIAARLSPVALGLFVHLGASLLQSETSSIRRRAA
jgi:hypothetical protein